MAEPKLRRAGPEDAASLAALSARALPADAWSERDFQSELLLAGARLWLVEGAAGEVLGYLAAREVAGELWIVSLAVDPGARRRGLGSLLLRHALARAQQQGARLVHLEVRASNAAAKALYARHGFLDLGTAGRAPDGEPRRALWLPLLESA